MSRVRAVVAGCLAEVALLFAATLPISHENAPSVLVLATGLSIGFVGGFVAGELGGPGGDPPVGVLVGVFGGTGFAALLFDGVVTNTSTGVFWHFHYLLATTVPPELATVHGTAVVVGYAALCGAAVLGLAVGGGWLSTHPEIRLPR